MLMNTLDATCDRLIELHRQRQDLHRAEKSLTLRIKAKCRRACEGNKDEAEKLYKAIMGKGEHEHGAALAMVCAPFLQARALIESQRKENEKMMEADAATLPAAEWVNGVRGVKMLSLASVIGEAGNLSNYPNPAKLWKRLGLAVIRGERQQKKPGDEAKEHGYCPSRRSVIWGIGDNMIRGRSEYTSSYYSRKEYEVERAESEGKTVVPQQKITNMKDRGKDVSGYMSQGHVHNRAKRYMEKRFIRDLWRAWRDAG